MSDADKFKELLVIIGNAQINDPTISLRAKSLIKSIDALGVRDRAWSELSGAAAKVSNWDLSESAASEILDPHFRSIALMKLASEQRRQGEIIGSEQVFRQAERVANDVIDPEEKSWGLYLLVSNLADCNDLANSKRIAESIKDAYDQSSAYIRIGDAHIEAQQSDDALKALLKAQSTIEDGEALDWAKGEVLCRTAKGMLRLGQTATAIQLLRKAISLVKGTGDVGGLNASNDRASVLREIIFTLELAGETDLACQLRSGSL